MQKLDPGVDRILRTPIQDTCEAFPWARILAINVTAESAIYQHNLSCPVLEFRIDVGDVAQTAMNPDSAAFAQVVHIGEEATLQALQVAELTDETGWKAFANSSIARIRLAVVDLQALTCDLTHWPCSTIK